MHTFNQPLTETTDEYSILRIDPLSALTLTLLPPPVFLRPIFIFEHTHFQFVICIPVAGMLETVVGVLD